MDFFIHFAYPWLLYFSIPAVALTIFLRARYYRPLLFRYSLASFFDNAGYTDPGTYKKILFIIRSLALIICAILIAKPRIIDFQSKIHGNGVDMIVALDVSNSMQFVDDPHDERSRLDIAKEEAIRFIDNREHDPIGLIIFGRDAVSRCPLTLDKNILKEIIKNTNLGTIDGRATLLYTGIILAANRLKACKGTSKVMIVLTDGTANEDDKTKEQAVAVAKKFGIKIYTIGIGPDGISYVNTPFGIQPIQGINKEDLQYIAQKTGGRFFEAKKPNDMKKIYAIIDSLEKTDYETNIFTHYHDLFKPFLWAIGILVLAELFLSSFVWFTV